MQRKRRGEGFLTLFISVNLNPGENNFMYGTGNNSQNTTVILTCSKGEARRKTYMFTDQIFFWLIEWISSGN